LQALSICEKITTIPEIPNFSYRGYFFGAFCTLYENLSGREWDLQLGYGRKYTAWCIRNFHGLGRGRNSVPCR